MRTLPPRRSAICPPPVEHPSNPRLSAGFTLLELSIVLVIIGLLIGGVFVGQSLIHNAQINAVIQEYGRYQAATQAFNEQYRGLPGDINNAGQIWGYANAAPATCKTTASTTTATCDGDGNGMIDSSTGSYEYLRFWQHLANAKMIEGSYNGAFGSVGADPGVTVPASKLTPAGWSIYPSTYMPGVIAGDTTTYFSADYGTGHLFMFGAWYNAGTDDRTEFPVITPKDAWSIDKKIDDGKPAQGNVIAIGLFGACTDAIGQTNLSATYRLSDSNKDCALIFLANF